MAILPQVQFVDNAKHLYWHIFYYFLAFGIYSAFNCMHLVFIHYNENIFDNIKGASSAVQFLLVFDFLLRAFPYVSVKRRDSRNNVSFIRIGDNNVTMHRDDFKDKNAILKCVETRL